MSEAAHIAKVALGGESAKAFIKRRMSYSGRSQFIAALKSIGFTQRGSVYVRHSLMVGASALTTQFTVYAQGIGLSIVWRVNYDDIRTKQADYKGYPLALVKALDEWLAHKPKGEAFWRSFRTFVRLTGGVYCLRTSDDITYR